MTGGLASNGVVPVVKLRAAEVSVSAPSRGAVVVEHEANAVRDGAGLAPREERVERGARGSGCGSGQCGGEQHLESGEVDARYVRARDGNILRAGRKRPVGAASGYLVGAVGDGEGVGAIARRGRGLRLRPGQVDGGSVNARVVGARYGTAERVDRDG